MLVERRGRVIAVELGPTGGPGRSPKVQRKAAAFARWHEPDDARVSSPDVCPVKASMFSGYKPAGAKVRRPVVGIAGWRETKTLEPIDEVSLRGDYESSGRNGSKRRS